MIKFESLCEEIPFLILKEKYDEAVAANQKNIDALCISSFNKEKNEVDSRFVNLKFIKNDEFIFFSNYNSPKASSFISHNQIAALIYWPRINVQIRMKAKIKKTPKEYNQQYFSQRSKEKNALSISSQQSKIIDSYDQVIEKHNETLQNVDLQRCPEYWGGFSFKPFSIEFWEGSDFRLNKRNLYTLDKTIWNHFILEP
tara:strand:- start:231 stop:827 length:597 start_codon:yes stop_codon:yes gene_type:complete